MNDSIRTGEARANLGAVGGPHGRRMQYGRPGQLWPGTELAPATGVAVGPDAHGRAEVAPLLAAAGETEIVQACALISRRRLEAAGNPPRVPDPAMTDLAEAFHALPEEHVNSMVKQFVNLLPELGMRYIINPYVEPFTRNSNGAAAISFHIMDYAESCDDFLEEKVLTHGWPRIRDAWRRRCEADGFHKWGFPLLPLTTAFFEIGRPALARTLDKAIAPDSLRAARRGGPAPERETGRRLQIWRTAQLCLFDNNDENAAIPQLPIDIGNDTVAAALFFEFMNMAQRPLPQACVWPPECRTRLLSAHSP